MSIAKKYKLAPIKTIFGKKKEFEEKVIDMAFHMAYLSLEEYKVLKAIKKGQDPDLDEEKLTETLETLEKGRMIIKN